MRAFRTKFVAAAVAMSTALAVGICSPAAAGPEPDVAPTSSKSQVPDLTAPAQGSHPDASRYVRQNPGAVPPGVNDFSCLPSPTRPRPVVLLHGTDSTAYSDFAALGPRLSAAGHRVFALNYGGRDGEANYGTEDIRNSAAQVAEFVNRYAPRRTRNTSTSSDTRRAPLSAVTSSTNSVGRRSSGTGSAWLHPAMGARCTDW